MAESNLPTTGEEVDLDDERPATATQESEATPTISKIDVQNDPLRDKAKVCLKKGNIEYRKGQTNEAMNSYTEGLQVNCKDTRLNAKLYSNRAAAHFHLGNYEECLSDATVSVQLEPNSMKAIKKGANACVKLCLYKEARSWLYKGLAIDENNKPLLNLLDKTNTELKARKRISYIYLGCAYSEQFRTEIEYHQHDLEIAKKVGDKAREGRRCASLGGAYLHLGQFKTAIKYIQRNLQIAKEVGDKAEEGRSYCNLGYVYRSLGEFKTAIGYFQRYLEIAKEVGDKAGEGVSYCNLGSVYHDLRQFKTAIRYFQRHLEIAKEVGDKAGEGTGYCNLGGAYNSLGQFKTAIGYHQRHLKIAKEVGDKAGEGASYANLGCAYNGLREFKNAIGYHQRRLEIAKEVGDKAGEGTSYATLGCAYFRLGQFKTAINCHQRHLEIAKEAGNKAEERIGYCNLGSAYGRLGLFKTAIEYQQRQLKIAKEVEDKAGEGSSYSNLGSCYGSLGKLQIAIEYYQRHLEIAKEVGDKTIEGTIYGNLGCAYNKLKLFETAMRYHQRHLEIAKEVGDKAGEGASYRNLGCSYAGLRQLKTAIEYLQRDLEITKEVGNKAEEASSLGLLGKCLEWEGNLKGALDVYDLSVEIHDDIMDRLQFNDIWKISYRNQHKDAYTGLWFIKLSLGEVVQALFAAEKGRAQALRDLLSSKYQFGDSSKYSSPCVSLSCVPSSTVFIAISGPYVYFWVVLGNGNVHLRKVHVNNYRYQDELEFFIEKMNRDALKEIGARRDAVTGENPQIDSLKEEEVANDVILIDVKSSQSTALQKLYDIIITPIGDLIVGNELIVVPEGPFCLVPYAALEDPKSTYLSDSLRIRVLPSLTTLRLIDDCPNEFHMKSGALLVGDPCFKHILYQGNRLSQLPGAKKEVEMIGRIFNISPLIREMASKYEVLKRLSSVALVHIASHGKMETGEILLAPNTTRENTQPQEMDYLMTMKDVLQAGLRAQLVVLSCCHTARGEVMAEGVVGIARAFLGAGARSVVVTLWAIEDEATLEFMSFFYDALTKGKRASEALNEAMKCLRESGNFKEVKQWAPFVLIGDDVQLDFKDM